jgi:diguanylate cyclase (GGDEF)-like protein/PAS domain S-box-containing protein
VPTPSAITPDGSRDLTRALLWLLPAAAALGAGVGGAWAAPAAAAVAVLPPGATVGAALVRQARETRRTPAGAGACRGVGLLGVGVVAGTLTVVATCAAGWLLPAGSPTAGRLAVGGVAVTALAFVLGLLLLPGAAPAVIGRLRRFLDGTGVGLCLFYSVWVLAIGPAGGLRTAAFVVAATACCAVAVALITGLRAARHRTSALLCAGGAASAIAGVAGVAGLAAVRGPAALTLPAALPALGGPLAIWLGARRSARTRPPVEASDESAALAEYPLLLIPVAGAVGATVLRLVTAGTFDRVATVLAIVGVALLGLREALAAVDVRRYARRMATQGAHFRSLVAESSDVTVLLDPDLVVRWLSPAAARQFALDDEAVLGRPFAALLHPDDAVQLTARITTPRPGGMRPAVIAARLRDGYGHWRDTESTVHDHRDVPEVSGFVVHIRDVGERKDLERTLHRLAFTDHLTGLANQRELVRTLTALRGGDGQLGSLVVADLTDFASINELRGRDTGDAVLVEVARRLRDLVGDGDLPVRLGGDSFAVLTTGTPMQSFALATRLLNSLADEYPLPGATVHLTVSVGLSDLHGPGSVDEVLRRADLALRRARQLGRNRIEWYDETVEAVMLRRMTLEQELPGVVARGELDLVFQPVLELSGRYPVGVESLLRWRHPRLGTVAPGEFTATADELNLGTEIGEWVLHGACRQLSAWLLEGRDVWLSVNLSASQLRANDLVERVAAAVVAHQVPADRLVVEIAEAHVDPGDQRVLTQLSGLRALGVRVALDHFGTGSTSLAHLRRLPLDILKLDRSLFAEPAGRGGPPQPIVDVVAGLGQRLGLDIVALGLEAEAHLDLVRRAGCRYGQGYLFARPAPAEHVEAYLESNRSPSV